MSAHGGWVFPVCVLWLLQFLSLVFYNFNYRVHSFCWMFIPRYFSFNYFECNSSISSLVYKNMTDLMIFVFSNFTKFVHYKSFHRVLDFLYIETSIYLSHSERICFSPSRFHAVFYFFLANSSGQVFQLHV
jgi:hypothetical protein